ncbi:hypothetical protein EDD15DRAFT_2369143 [Pisolithus albus]|nr:hypothetical protein EDD15DRAFT_2369143 [Pisolithus albus]
MQVAVPVLTLNHLIKHTQRSADETESGNIPVSVSGQVDGARRALNGMMPVPWVVPRAVEIAAQANVIVTDAQNISDTYMRPIKTFNSVVTTLGKVHPYVQMALGILKAAAQLIIAQVILDSAMFTLLEKLGSVYEFLLEGETIAEIENMKEMLARIGQVVSDSAQFIRNYSETKSFWKRMGKNILSETQTIVDCYLKTLDDLMQQYRDHAIRDIHVNMYRVLEDLNLEGMACAGGAGLNRTKRCLDGTRTQVMADIVSWIHNTDDNAPRILWLHGQAGKGKSAIAHTTISKFAHYLFPLLALVRVQKYKKVKKSSSL